MLLPPFQQRLAQSLAQLARDVLLQGAGYQERQQGRFIGLATLAAQLGQRQQLFEPFDGQFNLPSGPIERQELLVGPVVKRAGAEEQQPATQGERLLFELALLRDWPSCAPWPGRARRPQGARRGQ